MLLRTRVHVRYLAVGCYNAYITMKKFRISTWNSGRRRTIEVWVYDTPNAMREAGSKHDKRIGLVGTDLSKAYGLTNSFRGIRTYESGAIRNTPRAGHIRLSKDHLLTGIISHEATHMALAIYQQDIAKTIPDMEREEKLCYLVGDITSKIVDKLYQYKLL